MVTPVVLYGSEIWCDEVCETLEKLHLQFCKIILCLKKSTYNVMVYGELGRCRLLIAAKMRILPFWARLITSQETKIICMLYKLLYKMYVSNFYHSEWLYIKKTLCECGFPVFWDQQNIPGNLNYFKSLLNLRLKDQFLQS